MIQESKPLSISESEHLFELLFNLSDDTLTETFEFISSKSFLRGCMKHLFSSFLKDVFKFKAGQFDLYRELFSQLRIDQSILTEESNQNLDFGFHSGDLNLILLNDDLDSFQEYFRNHPERLGIDSFFGGLIFNSNFQVNVKQIALIDFCVFCGAVKCFKFAKESIENRADGEFEYILGPEPENEPRRDFETKFRIIHRGYNTLQHNIVQHWKIIEKFKDYLNIGSKYLVCSENPSVMLESSSEYQIDSRDIVQTCFLFHQNDFLNELMKIQRFSQQHFSHLHDLAGTFNFSAVIDHFHICTGEFSANDFKMQFSGEFFNSSDKFKFIGEIYGMLIDHPFLIAEREIIELLTYTDYQHFQKYFRNHAGYVDYCCLFRKIFKSFRDMIRFHPREIELIQKWKDILQYFSEHHDEKVQIRKQTILKIKDSSEQIKEFKNITLEFIENRRRKSQRSSE